MVNLIASFDEEALYQMAIGDNILVEAYGQGLQLRTV